MSDRRMAERPERAPDWVRSFPALAGDTDGLLIAHLIENPLMRTRLFHQMVVLQEAAVHPSPATARFLADRVYHWGRERLARYERRYQADFRPYNRMQATWKRHHRLWMGIILKRKEAMDTAEQKRRAGQTFDPARTPRKSHDVALAEHCAHQRKQLANITKRHDATLYELRMRYDELNAAQARIAELEAENAALRARCRWHRIE